MRIAHVVGEFFSLRVLVECCPTAVSQHTHSNEEDK